MEPSFEQKINDLMKECEDSEVKNFTFDLVDCVWYEFTESNFEDIDEDILDGYIEETINSLEIINPELEIDIEIMKKLLDLLENFKNSL